MRIVRLILFVFIMTGLISACATKRAVPPTSDNMASVAGLNSWYARGSYSVQNGDEVKNGNYEWKQTGRRFSLRLYGPLYSGNVLVEGGPRQTTLTEGRKITHASSPEALIKQNLNLDLPVAGLRYWLRGLPEPAAPARIKRDSAGKLASIEQDGWQITYLRYKNFARLNMPTLIQASRNQLSVRISVNSWEF